MELQKTVQSQRLLNITIIIREDNIKLDQADICWEDNIKADHPDICIDLIELAYVRSEWIRQFLKRGIITLSPTYVTLASRLVLQFLSPSPSSV